MSRLESEGRRDADRSGTESRSRSSSRVSTNRDRVRCYRCTAYDHFARECPNAITDEDSDGAEQTTLQMLTQDSHFDSDPYPSVECLNMLKGKNGTTSFLPLDSKKGGNVTYVKGIGCLTERHIKYIYFDW